jgi:hypothetical protein
MNAVMGTRDVNDDRGAAAPTVSALAALVGAACTDCALARFSPAAANEPGVTAGKQAATAMLKNRMESAALIGRRRYDLVPCFF